MQDLKRLQLAESLSSEVIDALLPHVFVREYPNGTILYRPGDPAESLYIIEQGEVDLLDPKQGRKCFAHLAEHAAFGRLSFLIGCPRATEAVTATDARLLIIPREAFLGVMDDAPDTREILAQQIEGQEVERFLDERLGLSPQQVNDWVARATAQLLDTGSFEPPVRVASTGVDVADFLAGVGRTGFFAALGDTDRLEMAKHLIKKSAHKRYTFFHVGELAQRLYILREGEVALFDPQEPSRRPHLVKPGEVFGQHAFFTDGPHTVTAAAAKACEYLVLRRKDFEALITRNPSLRTALANYLQRDKIEDYLTKRQRIDGSRAAVWLDKAVKSIQRGQVFPSLAEMKNHIDAHPRAAVAILLGVLLDGIPEALVVGASTVSGQTLSLTLLGSIFLSNFPEALSSAAGMREQGFNTGRILGMWFGLMVSPGLIARLGALTMESVPVQVFALIEGFAAGAMLTVVAETMLPEAYHRGGSIVGLSTLGGFLAAVSLSSLG